MKSINKLKVLTLILMVISVIFFAKTSFAATSITSISTSSGNASNNVVNNIPNNVVENTPKNNAIVNNAPTANNYNNVVSNIPETGAKSSTVLMFLIGLTSVSAVYTYIKVKKYNI
ncbi:MAG: hypothetical protein HFJ25_01290 [Clostridia bacterium]|jgi:predicted PurR-regulated permease PerM|nr:hypothetical protein [Clostridia bacterium]